MGCAVSRPPDVSAHGTQPQSLKQFADPKKPVSGDELQTGDDGVRPITASTAGDASFEGEDAMDQASSAPSDGLDGNAVFDAEPFQDAEEEEEGIPGSVPSPKKSRGTGSASRVFVPDGPHPGSGPMPEAPFEAFLADVVKGVIDGGLEDHVLLSESGGGRRGEEAEILDISDEDDALDVFVPSYVDLTTIITEEGEEDEDSDEGAVECLA